VAKKPARDVTRDEQAATTPQLTVMAAYHLAAYSIVRYLQAINRKPAWVAVVNAQG
jgi:hypothetical protein